MADPTQTELDRVRREIASCRASMNNPRVGLFAMKRLYAVYGSLLRQAEQLETQLAIDHVNGGDISAQPTVYRQG